MRVVLNNRKAKSFLSVIVVLLLAAMACEADATPAQTRGAITATAAILVDNQTGEILWQRNPDLPLPPASTTKIVTAMLALQSGRLDDPLLVTPEAAQAPPSKISLRPGWRMRLRDLVYAILLNSANDASVVIAEGLAGSVPAFAERMNAYARLLGARNSHFVNPNGLPAPNHYSTARDLATLFAHGMRDPLFQQIVDTRTGEVRPAAGSYRRIALHTHNRLLGNYRIHVAGKTGWTIAAKKCFVGAAQANGRELIVAVLGSRNLWGDLKRLIEFGIDGTTPPGVGSPELQIATAPTGPSVEGDDAGDAPKYAVRLATFRSLQNASRLKASVAGSGYPARIEKVRQRRRHLYRVAVGDYSSRVAAQQAAARLKNVQRGLTTLVVSSN